MYGTNGNCKTLSKILSGYIKKYKYHGYSWVQQFISNAVSQKTRLRSVLTSSCEKYRFFFQSFLLEQALVHILKTFYKVRQIICIFVMEKIEDIKVLVYNVSSIKLSALICYFIFILITTLMKFSFPKLIYESYSRFGEMSIN